MMDTASPSVRDRGLGEKVAFLSSPLAYSHRPREVATIETHMSWLFLTGTLAYKLKKPVRYPFLDFSSLGRRRHYCAEELRLNRRLAGSVYRRLVPLCRDESGALVLDGGGAIVDWLVEMEQLPDAARLDHRLQQGGASADDLVAVAERLASFYAAARPLRRAGFLYLKHLHVESEVNLRLLTRPWTGLDPDRTRALLERVGALLRRCGPAIIERIEGGMIVEGHGDLRPEHVFLGQPPRIIDCLEFDRSMRLLDPYDEINYLGLESELVGAPWVRPLVLDVLDRVLDRPPDPALLALYGAFRAMLRARICIAHLLDPEPADPERWPKKAERYLDVAERECLKAAG